MLHVTQMYLNKISNLLVTKYCPFVYDKTDIVIACINTVFLLQILVYYLIYVRSCYIEYA